MKRVLRQVGLMALIGGLLLALIVAGNVLVPTSGAAAAPSQELEKKSAAEAKPAVKGLAGITFRDGGMVILVARRERGGLIRGVFGTPEVVYIDEDGERVSWEYEATLSPPNQRSAIFLFRARLAAAAAAAAAAEDVEDAALSPPDLKLGVAEIQQDADAGQDDEELLESPGSLVMTVNIFDEANRVQTLKIVQPADPIEVDPCDFERVFEPKPSD